MTLGQSTVLLLTMPIILVALSALIFKEDVGWRRWTAIVVGFAGVFLVAGPLGGTPNYYLALTMVTAVTWAVRDLTICVRSFRELPTHARQLVEHLRAGNAQAA